MSIRHKNHAYRDWFKYMGKYWSCTQDALKLILNHVEQHGCIPDIYALGAKQLKTRPMHLSAHLITDIDAILKG